jgi:sugar lactone lactonase YvrE
LATTFLVVTLARAHPGSGIVADRQGRIYFVDTGAGVWKLEASGALTRVPGPALHWMTIDHDNRFAKTRLPSGPGWEIVRTGENPTLILASDFPLAIGRDGNLYYPKAAGKDGVEIIRLTPPGATSTLARLPVPWVNGMAAGPDGSLYVSEDKAIRKIDKSGRISTVVANVTLTGCATIPGSDPKDGPYLRGIDVDDNGTIVVAAAGCGSVLKITPAGKVETLVQLEAPWSPTAVVHVGRDVYVQEYLHVDTEDRRLWIPRIRKISPDGKHAVVATVAR